MMNWWNSSESSSIPLFFRPQETGIAETCKDGTHLTTDVRDKVAVLTIVAVLVLVVVAVTVTLVDVLVDKL
jgi:hypothetical protein